MDVSTAVAQRISTRAFKPDPLSEADIRDWLTAGAARAIGGEYAAVAGDCGDGGGEG